MDPDTETVTDKDTTSAMKRKAGAGRKPPEIGRPTPQRVLKAAVAQAAEDVAQLEVQVLQVQIGRTAPQSFTEMLPDGALLALCEGPGERFGMTVLDSQALAALIEVQTTGRVVPGEAAQRPPTRTDAVMVSGFIDRVLEGFALNAQEAQLDLAPSLTGYRFAMALPDTRTLLMTLDEIPYRLFDLTIDLGSGAKTGRMLLLLPHEQATRPGALAPQVWARALTDAVGCAAVTLRAVLARTKMPLHDVTALAPGSVIPLSREVIGRIRIEDTEARPVSGGRLGQMAGNRAVRLSPLCHDVDETPPAAPPGRTQLPGSVGAGVSAPDSPADMPELPEPVSGPAPAGPRAVPGRDDPSLPAVPTADDLAAFSTDTAEPA